MFSKEFAKGYIYPSTTKYITFSFQADKAVAEKKLSAAKPALEEAEAALQVSLAVFPLFFHDYGARKRKS